MAYPVPSIVQRVQGEWLSVEFWRPHPKYVHHNTYLILYIIWWCPADIFLPLFEVTKDPRTHPELHVFLQRVIGFDSVDDESKNERRIYRKFPVASMWSTDQSPPYSYWCVHLFMYATTDNCTDNTIRLYYMYANMSSLNNWRRARGFSQCSLSQTISEGLYKPQ